MLWSSGPEKIPGKSVRMSIRTLPPLRGGHHDAAARDVHLADELGNHRKEGLPLLAPDGEPVVSRPLLHPGDLPDADPRGVHHFAADQVRDVILPLLRGGSSSQRTETKAPDHSFASSGVSIPPNEKTAKPTWGLAVFTSKSPTRFAPPPPFADSRTVRTARNPDGSFE